jgi:hypothetical protein
VICGLFVSKLKAIEEDRLAQNASYSKAEREEWLERLEIEKQKQDLSTHKRVSDERESREYSCNSRYFRVFTVMIHPVFAALIDFACILYAACVDGRDE